MKQKQIEESEEIQKIQAQKVISKKSERIVEQKRNKNNKEKVEDRLIRDASTR